jgi:hypothetical protein
VKRSLLVVPGLLLALAACDLTDSDDKGASSDADRWSVDGISFAKPKGFDKIDADTVAGAAAGDKNVAAIAEDMGMSAEALSQVMAQFDLYLVKLDKTAAFANNVSVADPDGAMPSDEQLRMQMQSIGAKVREIAKVDTDLGKVTTATYTLDAGGVSVYGEAIFIDEDGAVVITTTTASKKLTDRVSTGILDTLDED